MSKPISLSPYPSISLSLSPPLPPPHLASAAGRPSATTKHAAASRSMAEHGEGPEFNTKVEPSTVADEDVLIFFSETSTFGFTMVDDGGYKDGLGNIGLHDLHLLVARRSTADTTPSAFAPTEQLLLHPVLPHIGQAWRQVGLRHWDPLGWKMMIWMALWWWGSVLIDIYRVQSRSPKILRWVNKRPPAVYSSCVHSVDFGWWAFFKQGPKAKPQTSKNGSSWDKLLDPINSSTVYHLILQSVSKLTTVMLFAWLNYRSFTSRGRCISARAFGWTQFESLICIKWTKTSIKCGGSPWNIRASFSPRCSDFAFSCDALHREPDQPRSGDMCRLLKLAPEHHVGTRKKHKLIVDGL